MKKIFYTFMALVLLSTQAFAADKAKIKVGASKATAKGQTVVAAVQGSFINLTMAGTSKRGSANVTVLIPTDQTFSKGDKFGVFSLVGEESASNPGEFAVSFNGTKIKVKGRSVGSTTYAEAAETVTTGKFVVKSYDPETKVLKFNLNAKASPYTKAVSNASGTKTKTPSGKLPIKVQGVVTLP